uniref:ribosomal protein S7 n=1 Tax=Prototheca miyajii TaxID=2034260 RepID=UPI003002D382
MSRRRTVNKRILLPDPVYKSDLIELIIRHLMKNGKKLLAYRIVYESMSKIAEITKRNPIKVLERAVRNVTPVLEVKARRKRGFTYQIPKEIIPERGTILAVRWILTACRKQTRKPMVDKLTKEILDASKKSGSAMKRKQEVHKMAEASKIFSRKIF